MKQIEVIIMGNSYLLGCPEGGENALRQAVARVDREMNTIRDSGKLKARERIAVLAALNLAYEQLTAPATAPSANTSAASHRANHGENPSNDSVAIDRLVHRLDQVLRADGHLL
jgi:cell division protein ZapA